MYRRIAWIRTDSSANILPFEQMGDDQTRKYYYAPLYYSTNGSATSFTFFGTNVPNSTTREILVSVTYTPRVPAIQRNFKFLILYLVPPMIQFGCG